MKRTRFLVCYDISDPKRLYRVAKTLESYGVRLQLSVFECPLDNLRLAEAKVRLTDILQHDEDQVLFVELGQEISETGLKIESLGLPYESRTRITIV